MIKPATFLKATATTLTACILAACGGESSDSEDKSANRTSQIFTTEGHSLTIYVPEDGAKVGKTIFDINIQETDGTAVSSVIPNMMPMMAMAAGHKHSSPHTGCTETDIDGNAQCSVYFLMPSEMNNVVMGIWDLEFSLPEYAEVVNFTPMVKMAMGDTVLAKLKGGADDQMPSMAMTMAMSDMSMNEMPASSPRTYFLFNNGITHMEGTHSVELFLAAKESMTSFPALTSGLTLNSATDAELSIDSIDNVVVKVSADNINWTEATSQGEGIWQATDISGLTTKLYVSLTVNGEQKTLDGEVADENNASAIFTLSSGDMSEMDM